MSDAGDFYYVYLTSYSLLHPFKDGYLDAFMLGFSCKRAQRDERYLYDEKTKATIIFVFRVYIDKYPKKVFLYICDNSDGLERNRRVTFGKWFNEVDSDLEHHHSHISYNSINWYSAMLLFKNNPHKELFLSAYKFTLDQMLNNSNG